VAAVRCHETTSRHTLGTGTAPRHCCVCSHLAHAGVSQSPQEEAARVAGHDSLLLRHQPLLAVVIRAAGGLLRVVTAGNGEGGREEGREGPGEVGGNRQAGATYRRVLAWAWT
jgi:hypothetical protein